MRELLLRAKCDDNGEWVYGVPLYGNWGDVFMIWMEPHTEYGEGEVVLQDVRREVAIIPETLGRDTGLTDKNGVKIFEGDILHNRSILPQWDKDLIDEMQVVVLIRKGMTRVEGWQANGYIGEEINQVHYGCLLLSPEIFEVIGNIHDNPELMENVE